MNDKPLAVKDLMTATNVVGIVSSRDLWMHIHRRRQDQISIGSIMNQHVITVPPEMPAADAAALLLRNKIGSLPVVDDDGRALHGVAVEPGRAKN